VSHHFDSPTAIADGRINLCDLFVFPGVPGTTTLILTVNPDAGRSSATTSRNRAPHGTGTKRFNHPDVGELTLAYEELAVTAEPGLTLILYTAEPGSPSAEKPAPRLPGSRPDGPGQRYLGLSVSRLGCI